MCIFILIYSMNFTMTYYKAPFSHLLVNWMLRILGLAQMRRQYFHQWEPRLLPSFFLQWDQSLRNWTRVLIRSPRSLAPLVYQEIISVHPTRRQIFAGKTDLTFPNIWQWVICTFIHSNNAYHKSHQSYIGTSRNIFWKKRRRSAQTSTTTTTSKQTFRLYIRIQTLKVP